MTIQTVLKIFGAALVGVAFVSWGFMGPTIASILLIATATLFLITKFIPKPTRVFLAVGLIVGALFAFFLPQIRIAGDEMLLYILIMVTVDLAL